MAYNEIALESNFYFYLELCDNDIFKLVKKAKENSFNMPLKFIEKKAIDILIENGFSDEFIASALDINLRRVRGRRSVFKENK